jgi:imidazolonepropionase-like amidohydrolase
VGVFLGKLGVVEEGAFGDLLLVDGDPVANIKLIEDPAKNFLVIMKGGNGGRGMPTVPGRERVAKHEL